MPGNFYLYACKGYLFSSSDVRMAGWKPRFNANSWTGTWNEFLDWFATEEACQAFLEKLR